MKSRFDCRTIYWCTVFGIWMAAVAGVINSIAPQTWTLTIPATRDIPEGAYLVTDGAVTRWTTGFEPLAGSRQEVPNTRCTAPFIDTETGAECNAITSTMWKQKDRSADPPKDHEAFATTEDYVASGYTVHGTVLETPSGIACPPIGAVCSKASFDPTNFSGCGGINNRPCIQTNFIQCGGLNERSCADALSDVLPQKKTVWIAKPDGSGGWYCKEEGTDSWSSSWPDDCLTIEQKADNEKQRVVREENRRKDDARRSELFSALTHRVLTDTEMTEALKEGRNLNYPSCPAGKMCTLWGDPALELERAFQVQALLVQRELLKSSERQEAK